MNKHFIYLSTAVVLVLLLINYGCVKEIGKVPPPPSILCDSITYEQHVKPIIDANCLGCHGDISPSGGFPLTSYNDVRVKAVAGKIEARVIKGVPSFMPAGADPLPQAQMDIINCWLQNGYKP